MNNPEAMRRWTHTEQGTDQAETIRAHVFGYLLNAVKKAHLSIEEDIAAQLHDPSAKKILDALLFQGNLGIRNYFGGLCPILIRFLALLQADLRYQQMRPIDHFASYRS